ncbi:hypothetical protein BDW02DRAFT_19746 [Decorospora gaudefroyi]|uniref:Uncharacterized protein n=1 Tax=Decorospora gaudefroyi TaxID=184978 RepID=A0A6A5K4R6_9PLEO|nr:hypothetical protein BDW02DRAFT_19746 [Decorospora gaudefroyi]
MQQLVFQSLVLLDRAIRGWRSGVVNAMFRLPYRHDGYRLGTGYMAARRTGGTVGLVGLLVGGTAQPAKYRTLRFSPLGSDRDRKVGGSRIRAGGQSGESRVATTKSPSYHFPSLDLLDAQDSSARRCTRISCSCCCGSGLGGVLGHPGPGRSGS